MKQPIANRTNDLGSSSAAINLMNVFLKNNFYFVKSKNIKRIKEKMIKKKSKLISL